MTPIPIPRIDVKNREQKPGTKEPECYSPVAVYWAIMDTYKEIIEGFPLLMPCPLTWLPDKKLLDIQKISPKVHLEWLLTVVIIILGFAGGPAGLIVLNRILRRLTGGSWNFDDGVPNTVVLLYLIGGLTVFHALLCVSPLIWMFQDVRNFQQMCIPLAKRFIRNAASPKDLSRLTTREIKLVSKVRIFFYHALAVPFILVSMMLGLSLDPYYFLFKKFLPVEMTNRLDFRIGSFLCRFVVYLLCVFEMIRIATMLLAVGVSATMIFTKFGRLWRTGQRLSPRRGFKFYRYLVLTYSIVRTLARVSLTNYVFLHYIVLVALYFFTLKMYPHLPFSVYLFGPYTAGSISAAAAVTLFNITKAYIICDKEIHSLKYFLPRRKSYMTRKLRSIPVWCFELGGANFRTGCVQKFFPIRYFFEILSMTATLSLIIHVSD